MRVLVTEYFHFPSDIRRKEVLSCIEKNVKSGLFDKVVVLSEKDECPVVPDTVITGVRLSYKYTFEYVNKNISHDNLIFVANSDILFDESIKKVTLNDKTALTLTRWELNPERLHENMVASQDVWGFQTPIRVPPKSDFYFGTYGCDNYIAALLEGEGYTLWNPCLSVKTYHIHASEVRTYEVKPLKPFYNYAFPDPSTLEEEFPASFCTMSNKNCKDELLAMLLSIRKHHPTEPIYIVADSETKHYIETCAPFLKNLHISKTLDKHNVDKYKVLEIALMFSPDTLLIESSSIILDRIVVNKTVDIGISPNYVNDSYESINNNFIWTKNKQVCKYLKETSLINLLKIFSYFVFNETYNVGWWRLTHSPKDPTEFTKYFWIQGPTYKGRRLKCINTHFDDTNYKDFNNIIIKIIVRSFRWFEMLLIERIPENCDSSFRELALLTSERVEDFKVVNATGIDFPRLGQFVCLCDKEDVDENENDFEKSLKVFINKSEYDDVKMYPWIHWPKNPRKTEEFVGGGETDKFQICDSKSYIECIGLGIVPVIPEGIPKSIIEGVHYVRDSRDCSNWEEMSNNCREWYMDNVHSTRWFTTMLKTIMYKL